MRIGISVWLVAVQVLVICFLNVSDATVQSARAENPGGPHLYFITSAGCAPCKQVEPAIEALKREGYPVTTVNIDANQQFVRQFGVDRTPTVVLVSNNKMVGRHAGLIDGVTLKRWFAAVGVRSGSAFAQTGSDSQAGGTKVVLPNSNVPGGRTGLTPGNDPAAGFSSPTMLKGTRQAGNAQEQRAMQATVRLKVEDPKGTSYATGTVIHSHQGESLVVTCGHVFRDAKGAGTITAEYGFESGSPKSVSGELIFYDSDARDIGLVAIQTPARIEPVPIAARDTVIERGRDIFSIGCDHGEPPTIRRSQVKNRAAYDGAVKYDIHGRPVDGRSGGGLFTQDGDLIGVCNAAAVEVDEGIYTALDTIYWQLARVNLEHLFNGQQLAASQAAPQRPVPVVGASNQTFANAPNVERGFAEIGSVIASTTPLEPIANRQSARTDVAWGQGNSTASDKEIIILVRSKTNPAQTDTITIKDPTPKLLDYLGTMNSGQIRQIDVARLRKENEIRRR